MAEGVADGAEPGSLVLRQAAELHGAYRWVERRLAQTCGTWATAVGTADEVRLHFYEASAQHAWHAELWRELLPVLEGVDPERLTRPVGPVLGPLLDALDEVGRSGEEGEASVCRLAALHRVVLPRLLVTYERHRSRARPPTDGPTLRALRLVLADERDQTWAGEVLLQSILRMPADARLVAEVQVRLESLALAAGPTVAPGGLVPWPGGAAG